MEILTINVSIFNSQYQCLGFQTEEELYETTTKTMRESRRNIRKQEHIDVHEFWR